MIIKPKVGKGVSCVALMVVVRFFEDHTINIFKLIISTVKQ